ncbi:Oxygen-independent coproporphyrinogen III oxidase [uncultured Gammaproteobacteria bacterium]
MNAELLAKYDGMRVPRYTSYPTAPNFSPNVGGDSYLGWLSGIAPGTVVSLYLHVPFCKTLCWYCGCNTRIVGAYPPVMGYLESLHQEIAMVAAALPGRVKVGHIHWGGGTPNLVEPEDFLRLMTMLRERFELLADAELAVEIDPRRLTAAHVAAMAQAGINRASLGVQDFDADVQRAVNRVQPESVTRESVAMLRAAGIGAINLDLMYGLPGQTEASCRRTAEIALTMAPQRLSVFGYAHVPWMKKHQKRLDESALPDGTHRWRQFAAIAHALIRGGMTPIGLDHFAHPDDSLAVAQRHGQLHRNFQGYTTDSAGVLIGFGASAIGALPQGYVQNATKVEDYMDAIAHGRPAIARGRAITPDDALRRDLIERLMCDLEVDLNVVTARHGVDPASFDRELASLEGPIADGIVERHGRTLKIPECARPMVRVAAAAFDAYLPATQGGGPRHATAI